MSFSQLNLGPNILRALEENKYTKPSPIQEQAIPEIQAGHDLIASAQTGTGKTAAFTLPLLDRIAANKDPRVRTTVLILTPTRELAFQINENIEKYSRYLPIRSLTIFGGVGMQPQIRELRRGVDILVATPGRLLDHIRQKNIRLDTIQTLVLDEADRMLDMGFIHDVRRIIETLPRHRQNLLFSATFSKEIKALTKEILNHPKIIQISPENTAVEVIQQIVHPVDKGKRRQLLAHLIEKEKWSQVLVFTRTKHGANRLAEQLGKDGFEAMAIHGNKSQGARLRALDAFKKGRIRALIATDIAARGIDIHELPFVVNYDLPLFDWSSLDLGLAELRL